MAFNITGQLNLQLASGAIGRISSQINAGLRGSAMTGVNVPVRADTAGIKSITNSLGTATTAFERFTMQSGLSFKRFAAFSLAAAPFMQLSMGIRSTISQAIEFDRQMTRLRQVSGDSGESIRLMGEQVTRLSTTFGVSSRDLAKTAVILRQADLSSKDTSIALEALAKSALAPNFDSITQTTEGAIAVMKQFDIEAKDLEGALGSMNAVAGGFAVEAGDLIEVVRRTGGAFKASGGDLNELLALFTSVRQTTRESAESISTGLRTIFTRIQRNDTVENLKQIGVELRTTKEEARDAGDMNLEGRFVGAYEAVRRLSIGLSQLSQADSRYSSVVESLGGYRQIDKVIPLVQQLAVSERALTTAEAGRVSLQVSASQAADSYSNKLVRLQESYLSFGRSLMDTSSFKTAFEGFDGLARSILSVLEAAKPLIPLLATIATVSIVRNIIPVVGNFAKGASSQSSHVLGRNAGGVVYMASGGTVPGTGDSDTVPAKVAPGSFVIRKSSAESLGLSGKPNVMLTPGEHVFAPNEVKTIGIDRLNHMNQYGGLPRFSEGGPLPPGGGQNTPERLTQKQLAELLGVSPNSLARTIKDAGIDFQTGANKRKFYDAEQARAFAIQRSGQTQAAPVTQPQPAPVVQPNTTSATQTQAEANEARAEAKFNKTVGRLFEKATGLELKGETPYIPTSPKPPPDYGRSVEQIQNAPLTSGSYTRQQYTPPQTSPEPETTRANINRKSSPYFATLPMFGQDPESFTGTRDTSTTFKKKDTLKGVQATDFIGSSSPKGFEILSVSIDKMLSKAQPWLNSIERTTKAMTIATEVNEKAKQITGARAQEELSLNVQKNAAGRASDIQELMAIRKSALAMQKQLSTNPNDPVLVEEFTTKIVPRLQSLSQKIQENLGFDASQISSPDKLPKTLVKSLRSEQKNQESIAAGAGMNVSFFKEMAETIQKEIGKVKIKVGTNLSGMNVADVSGINPELLAGKNTLAPDPNSLPSLIRQEADKKKNDLRSRNAGQGFAKDQAEVEVVEKQSASESRKRFMDQNVPLYQRRLGLSEDLAKDLSKKRYEELLKTRQPIERDFIAPENREEQKETPDSLATRIRQAADKKKYDLRSRNAGQGFAKNQAEVEVVEKESAAELRQKFIDRNAPLYQRRLGLSEKSSRDVSENAYEELLKSKQPIGKNLIANENIGEQVKKFEEEKKISEYKIPAQRMAFSLPVPNPKSDSYTGDVKNILGSLEAGPTARAGKQNISVMASERETLKGGDALSFLVAMGKVPKALDIVTRTIYENLRASRPDLSKNEAIVESSKSGTNLINSSKQYEDLTFSSSSSKAEADSLRQRAEKIEKFRSLREEYKSINPNDLGMADRRKAVGKDYLSASKSISDEEFSGSIAAKPLRKDPTGNIDAALIQRAQSYRKQAEEQDRIAKTNEQKANEIAKTLSATKITILNNSDGSSSAKISADTGQLGIKSPSDLSQSIRLGFQAAGPGLATTLDENVKKRAEAMAPKGGYDSLAQSTKESLVKEEINKLYARLIPNLTEEIASTKQIKDKEVAYAMALEKAAAMLSTNAGVDPAMLVEKNKSVNPNSIAGRLASNIEKQASLIDPRGKGANLTEETRKEIENRETRKLHDQYVKSAAPQIVEHLGLKNIEEGRRLASKKFNRGISGEEVLLTEGRTKDEELYRNMNEGNRSNYNKVLKSRIEEKTSSIFTDPNTPIPSSIKKSILSGEEERIRQEYVKNVGLQIQQKHKILDAEVAQQMALERYTKKLNDGSLKLSTSGGQIIDKTYERLLLKEGISGLPQSSSPNFVNGIAKTIANSFSSQSGFFGLQAIGSYASAGFAPQQGAIDAAVNMVDARGEKIGEDESKARLGTLSSQKAASGLLAGAASGAAIGTMFGPWGPAIGAAAGAAYGFATGLRDAATEIGDARIGYVLKKTTEALENFSRGTFALTQESSEKIKENQTTVEKEISLKSARGASMFGGGFLYTESAFQGQLAKNSRESEGTLAGPMMNALTKIMEDQAIATANNPNAKDIAVRKLNFNTALDLNGGIGRSMLSRVASATQQDPILLQRKMLESFTRMQENELVKRNRDKGETNVNRTGAMFGSLSTAVESASIRLSKMSASVKNLSDFMDSSISSYGGPGLTESLQKPFAAPGEFLSSIDSVLKATGTKDPQIQQQASAIVITGQLLPSIISAVRSQPAANITAGRDFSIQVGDILRDRLKEKGVDNVTASAMSSTIQSQIGGEDFAKVLRESGQDMGKLIDKLLGPMSEPLKQSFSSIARNLDERSKTFSDGLTELANRTKSAGEMMDKVSVLRGAATRNTIGTAVRHRGITEEGGDSIRFDLSNQIDQMKQQRLTGFGGNAGLNPDLISIALDSVFKQIKTSEKKVDQASKSGDIVAQNNASIELTGLKLRASDLNQALRNLTDTTERNAVAQEKLSKIQSEREARQSFGIRYATSNNEGRQEIASSFRLLTAAVRMGTAAPFSVRDQNKIFGLLSSLSPQMSMRGLGGATVKEISASLLSTTFGGAFDLDPQSAAIEKSLESFVQKNYDTAVRAAQMQLDMQRQIQSEFFSKLQNNQDGFVSHLARVMDQNARMMQETLRLQAQTKVTDLTKQIGESSVLGKIGVKTEPEFKAIKDSLARPGGNIQGIFDAAREKREVESKATTAKERSGDFAKTLATSFGDVSTSGVSSSIAAATINNLISELGFTTIAEKTQISKLFSEKLAENAPGQNFRDVPNLVAKSLEEAIDRFSESRGNAADVKIKKNETGLRDAGVISAEMIGKIVQVAKENADDTTLTSIRKSIEAVDSTTFKFDELQKKLQEAKDQVEKFNKALAVPPVGGVADGGAIRFFNKGGWADGGSATAHPSDTINARIAPKEFVVAAGPAQQHKKILEKMNGGEVMRYAEGGIVASKNLISDEEVAKRKIEMARIETKKMLSITAPISDIDKVIKEARVSAGKAGTPAEQKAILETIDEAEAKLLALRKENLGKRKKLGTESLDPNDFEQYHIAIRQYAIKQKLIRFPNSEVEEEIKEVMDKKKQFQELPKIEDLEKYDGNPMKVPGEHSISNDTTEANKVYAEAYTNPSVLSDKISEESVKNAFGTLGGHRGAISFGLDYDDRYKKRGSLRARMTDKIIRRQNDNTLGVFKYPVTFLSPIPYNLVHHATIGKGYVNKSLIEENFDGDVGVYLDGWYGRAMSTLASGKTPSVFAAEEIKSRKEKNLWDLNEVKIRKEQEESSEKKFIESLFTGEDNAKIQAAKNAVDPKNIENSREEEKKRRLFRSYLSIPIEKRREQIVEIVESDKKNLNRKPDFTDKNIAMQDMNIKVRDSFNNLNVGLQQAILSDMTNKIKPGDDVDLSNLGIEELSSMISSKSRVSIETRVALEAALRKLSKDEGLEKKKIEDLNPAEKIVYLSGIDSEARSSALKDFRDLSKDDLLEYSEKFIKLPNFANDNLKKKKESGPSAYAREAFLLEFISSHLGIPGNFPKASETFGTLKFASGGLVPGTGNTDSVRANLPVGSYVVRKSSVNSIGSENLASMSHMASGGIVPAMVMPGEHIFTPKEASRIGTGRLDFMNRNGRLPGFAEGGAVPALNNPFQKPQMQQQQPQQLGANNPNDFFRAKNAQEVFEVYGGDIPKMKVEYFQQREKLRKIKPKDRIKEEVEAFYRLHNALMSPELIAVDNQRHNAAIRVHAQEFANVDKRKSFFESLERSRNLMLNKRADRIERMRAQEEYSRMLVSLRLFDPRMVTIEAAKFHRQRIRDRMVANAAAAAPRAQNNIKRPDVEVDLPLAALKEEILSREKERDQKKRDPVNEHHRKLEENRKTTNAWDLDPARAAANKRHLEANQRNARTEAEKEKADAEAAKFAHMTEHKPERVPDSPAKKAAEEAKRDFITAKRYDLAVALRESGAQDNKGDTFKKIEEALDLLARMTPEQKKNFKMPGAAGEPGKEKTLQELRDSLIARKIELTNAGRGIPKVNNDTIKNIEEGLKGYGPNAEAVKNYSRILPPLGRNMGIQNALRDAGLIGRFPTDEEIKQVNDLAAAGFNATDVLAYKKLVKEGKANDGGTLLFMATAHNEMVNRKGFDIARGVNPGAAPAASEDELNRARYEYGRKAGYIQEEGLDEETKAKIGKKFYGVFTRPTWFKESDGVFSGRMKATFDKSVEDFRAGNSLFNNIKPEEPPRPRLLPRKPTGMASGGIVGGFGGGDSVPALLEPGELVVPRRQVKKFASGGIVGGTLPFASGGEVGGGSSEMLDSASRFAQAATQISQGLSGFSTSVGVFGDSVGSFGAFVDKFDEAVSKMPGEITLSGANDISVNIMGQDSIVKAVTEALGPMIAEAIRSSQPVEQRAQ